MTVGRVLTHAEARRFYDLFGATQDSQVFYERPALEELVRHLDLDGASAVIEFGCGTGRFAAELLRERLGSDAAYLGLDVSLTMVSLARKRLEPFAARAEVLQTDGSPRIDAAEASFDRFLSTYVLDLLSLEDLRVLLDEAHRVLQPRGLIGLVGLTPGRRGFARAVSAAWKQVHRLQPVLLGGCRPMKIASVLSADEWNVLHHGVVTSYGIASEILIAAPAA